MIMPRLAELYFLSAVPKENRLLLMLRSREESLWVHMPSRLTQRSYRVGVGQQNGGSSSYHMPVRAQSGRLQSSCCKEMEKDPKRPTHFIFILYGAALFVMDTITEESRE